MKVYIEKIIVKNRAPFDNLNLDFKENEIAVLTAINGSGKTTLLSHIVDAWHEMARSHFPQEFEGKENKFYRVSSSVYNLNQSQPSFIYIRFKINGERIDYVDIRNKCTQQQYDEVIRLDGKIPFAEIEQNLEQNNYIKHISSGFDKKKAENIFNNNVITYFPSYRYEIPGYLTDPYKIDIKLSKDATFTGYLNNPIEVVSDLPQLANWIMDVILDMELYKRPMQLPNGEIVYNSQEQILLGNLNLIITETLISKKRGNLRFGIGKRNSGGTRISIINVQTNNQLYPTIFNLSSGEASMLCLFGEILKQADRNRNNIPLNEITGIVLIDEVDKHLHIKLQKEVLPVLFQLFPNVQFILSSHSPFLNMGLAEKAKERATIFDLDNMGISIDPIYNELYTEVYNMMVRENDRFKESYLALKQAIDSNTKPLIITEGKTDTLHLKRAKEILNIEDCDVEFYQIIEDWGDSKLKLLLEQLSKVRQNRKIIGIFDRDAKQIVSDIEKDAQPYKNYSNNVYAFCIPVPADREAYINISIEFYYTDEEIKKEKDRRRLYFDNEVESLHNKTKNLPEYRKLEVPNINKELLKKVFDEEKMCEVADWIHSKANFANLISTDNEFIKGFVFSNFNIIFDKIKEIMKLPNM